MKPGILKWATNNNFAAGPDVGSATKVPPTSGQEADGYYRNNKPSAQIWNYKRWGIDLKLQQLESMWVKNWQEASNVLSSPQPVPTHGFYDSYQKIHTVHDADGGGTGREVTSLENGRVLTAAASAITGPSSCYDGFATDDATDTRVTCHAGLDALFYSTSLGAWTLWTGLGATGITFHKGHFYNGRYVFLEGTNADIYSTVSTGTIPTIVDTGFTGSPCKILHTRHVSGVLYPNDPGNLIWLALAGTQVNTSTDGTTWGAPWAHGIGVTLDTDDHLAYGAYNSRWIATTKTITGGLGVIAISDDNGATWTTYNRLPYYRISANVARTWIATDGFGTWVTATLNTTTDEVDLCFSIDNGETWHPLFLPFAGLTYTTTFGVSLWYGGGQFNLAYREVTTNDYRQFHSLTIEEP
jgi:hypothetical protein